MASSNAERQHKKRTKLKSDGKYAEYRKKETDYHKKWEARKKASMTTEQKLQLREFERLRKRKQRAALRYVYV